jgi:hypothetical protein
MRSQARIREEDRGGSAQVPPNALASGEAVALDLVAAVLAVRSAEPVVAIRRIEGRDVLPSGPFRPRQHDSLESGTLALVAEQTGGNLAFAHHLCADCCAPTDGAADIHTVAVGHIGLANPAQRRSATRAIWKSWYTIFPWEDWRAGKPPCLSQIEDYLATWAAQPAGPSDMLFEVDRPQRVRIAFGSSAGWDEEKLLERYALMIDAGLIGANAASAWTRTATLQTGHALILARAVTELRRTVKYRPVVFELMPEAFTLFEMQRVVEAILGLPLHKQNFRRLVESCRLVEPAGETRMRTGGRPARLYRFRRDVMFERAAPGVRLRPGGG